MEGEQPTSGVLTSPGYPGEYQNRLDVVQKIQVPEGNTIWIRFTDFDCESELDWVSLEEGTDSRTFGWYNYPNDDESDDDDDDDEDNYNFETNWRKQVVSNTDTVLLTGVGGWNGVSMKEILIVCIINTLCIFQEWSAMRRASQQVGS